MKKSTSNERRSELSIAFAIAFAGACAMAALAIVVPAHAATNAKPAVAAAAADATEPMATIAPPTTTLERIKAAGKIVLGYRADAAPMSYRDSSGQPAGYAITLCNRVVDAMKSDVGRIVARRRLGRGRPASPTCKIDAST